MSIRLREARDEAFIAQLGRAAFGEYDAAAAQGSVSLARRGHTLVAEDGALLLGFVVVEAPVRCTAHLSAIAVVEDARGRGIGQALVRAAERSAAKAGALRVDLTTADSNLPALGLFLRNGYTRTERVGVYSRGQRSVNLEKTL